jgi:hypothetical protein
MRVPLLGLDEISYLILLLLLLLLYSHLLDLGRFFTALILYIISMTPWAVNLPSQVATYTQGNTSTE